MTDSIQSLTTLQTELASNGGTRGITAAFVRNGVYSTLGVIPYTGKSATYTATENDEFIACDATGGAITINLPPCATTRVGKRYCVKKIDSSGNAVTLDGNASEVVESATTLALSTQYSAAVIVNSGVKWYLESKYVP